MELNSISALCPGSLAGLVTLDYAPTTWVEAFERMTNSSYSNRAEVDFESGKTWLTLPVRYESATWREPQRNDPQGDTFEAALDALLPYDTPAIRGQLDAMRRHRFLLRLRFRDGSYSIVGTVEQPLAFSSEADSGQKMGDFRGHRVRFSGPQIGKSPGYDPAYLATN